jgi:hypothetical protein
MLEKVTTMSTRDEPSLSEQERAILAGLAAQAEAEDPRLARSLRGARRRSLDLRLPPLPPPLRHWALGAALAVLGLALAVAFLTVSLPLAMLGAALLFVGVARTVVSAPWATRERPRPQPQPRQPSAG